MKKIILTLLLSLTVLVGCKTFHSFNSEVTDETYSLIESATIDMTSSLVDKISKDKQEELRLRKEIEEHYCMSLAIYKEVRGEPESAQIKVSQVIMNRVNDKTTPYFDDSVCDVVKKKLNKTCMFSFWCEKGSEYVNDKESFKRSEDIASKALKGEYKHVTNATYFKNCSFKSKFFNKLKFLSRSGKVCFYQEYAKR